MSYKKYSIPQLDSKTGFDKASAYYHTYRSHLNSVDKNQFLRYLPRSLHNLTILDIGAGDGRVFEHFRNSDYQEYIALDISDKMLAKFHSSQVTKICADASEHIPLADNSIDLALSFFFFEYVPDLYSFFEELYRVMKPGATLVATYFYQRNAFVFGHGDEAFKVEREPHTYDDLRKASEYHFFHLEETPVIEKGKIVGYIYVFTK